MSSLIFTQFSAFTAAYYPQVPPVMLLRDTLFPTKLHPIRPPPLEITVPAPSKPGMQGKFGIIPYLPLMKAMSEGFMGAAYILTKT